MQSIVVLDFGGQYAQLLARRVRELHVYCELLPYDAPRAEIERLSPRGFILSGGPSSVYDDGAPTLPPYLLNPSVPVLGVCYGMQLLAHALHGDVRPSAKREYGPALLNLCETDTLLANLPPALNVWMSHGDTATAAPPGFTVTAKTEVTPVAAIENPASGLYGVQFHPEVHHTRQGTALLRHSRSPAAHPARYGASAAAARQAAPDPLTKPPGQAEPPAGDEDPVPAAFPPGPGRVVADHGNQLRGRGPAAQEGPDLGREGALAHWHWTRIAALTVLIGVGYTVFSEWMNITLLRSWTYAELLADAERIARALLSRFAPGERVAIWAPNCAEWLVVQHGVSLAGATAYCTHQPCVNCSKLLISAGIDRIVYEHAYPDAIASALLADVTGRAPDLQVALLAAGDFESLLLPEADREDLKAARQADLLVVEDLQHLPARVEAPFVHLVDRGLARGQQLVFTALAGPAQLVHLPARMTSRFGSGLVIGLEPLSPSSRRTFLRDRINRRELNYSVSGLMHPQYPAPDIKHLVDRLHTKSALRFLLVPNEGVVACQVQGGPVASVCVLTSHGL